MKIRKPKEKGRKELGKIVVPKIIEDGLSFQTHNLGEGFGFLYGIKDAGNIYTGSFSQLCPLSSEELNPMKIDLDTEAARRYIKMHNKMCGKGEKMFPNFVQIAHHTHLKLVPLDFSREERKDLRERFPGFQGKTKDLVGILDNTWLSKEDIDFIRKNSSYGLAALSVGREGNIRTMPRKYFRSRFFDGLSRIHIFQLFKHLFGYEESRLIGYQIDKNRNVWEVPIEQAEKSESYIDEERSRQIVEEMKPLTNLYMNYVMEISEEVRNRYPHLTDIFKSVLKTTSVEHEGRKYQLKDPFETEDLKMNPQKT